MLLAPIALCFMRSSKEGAQNIIQAVLEDQEYFKVSIDQGYRNRNLSYD